MPRKRRWRVVGVGEWPLLRVQEKCLAPKDYILYLCVKDFLSFLNLRSSIQQKCSWENANPKKFLYYSDYCCSWNASDGSICCNSKSKLVKQRLASVILGPLSPMVDRYRMPFSFSHLPSRWNTPAFWQCTVLSSATSVYSFPPSSSSSFRETQFDLQMTLHLCFLLHVSQRISCLFKCLQCLYYILSLKCTQ